MKRQRYKVLSASALLFSAVVGIRCGGSSDSLRPEATVATTQPAQSSFRPIRDQWLLSTAGERASLAPRIEAFRNRYRHDPLARVAQAYLAFIALYRDDAPRARRLARSVRKGPMGNTRDLGTLIEGASLAQTGTPEKALRLLDPLVGKLIDPFAQDLLHEAVVGAAVDAHRWYQAVVYMNEWIRSTQEQDRPAVRKHIDEMLLRFPPASLESALRAMGSKRQGDIWEEQLREALAARLAKVAVERSDAKLARSVLETSRSVVGMGEAGTSLAQLATSGGRAPRIIGARVGLLVETDASLRATRSAQAVAGALEVFKPNRSMDGLPGHAAAEPPVLVTHDVASSDRVNAALDDLAYRGASVIVGGYDPQRSAEIASYAETRSIPVLLLVAPAEMPAGARYTFVAGLPEPRWSPPVAPSQAASQVDPRAAARIGVGAPPDGIVGASCDRRPSSAGETTFPVAAWRNAAVRAVAVDGPGPCADALLSDLRNTGFTPLVVLGLEARPTRSTTYDGPLRVARSGYLDAPSSEEPPSLRAWRVAHGSPPVWFEALGRDAAQIAHDAVTSLPRGTVTEPRRVERLRAVVQQALQKVEGTLWTTKARGFGESRALPRTVRFVGR